MLQKEAIRLIKGKSEIQRERPPADKDYTFLVPRVALINRFHCNEIEKERDRERERETLRQTDRETAFEHKRS